jgi:hypothetical protein
MAITQLNVVNTTETLEVPVLLLWLRRGLSALPRGLCAVGVVRCVMILK